MMLSQIVERLERIEELWSDGADTPRIRAIERLRLDIEIAIRREADAKR